MKKELEEKLFNDFPKLFIDHNKTPAQTAMCWGCSCGDGWYDIIYTACEKLQALKLSDLRFLQIKEKFASLRLYLNSYNADVDEVIGEATKKSMKTCEQCGSIEDVKQRGEYYSRVLCKKCDFIYNKIGVKNV